MISCPDPNINDHNYEKLLATATECRLLDLKDKRIMIGVRTTITNNIPGVTPLYLMCFWPFVELLVYVESEEKKTAFHIRLYKKTMKGGIKLCGGLPLRTQMAKGDRKDIETLRTNLDRIHVDDNYLPDLSVKNISNTFTQLMERPRNPLRFDILPTLPEPTEDYTIPSTQFVRTDLFIRFVYPVAQKVRFFFTFSPNNSKVF